MEKILSKPDVEILILGQDNDSVELFQEGMRIIHKKEIDVTDANYFLFEKTVFVVIVKIVGRIVGMAIANVIIRPDSKILMIYEIDVTKKDRNQGIASSFIEYLKTICHELGFTEMFVLTNSSNRLAMNLYENTGGARENNDDVVFNYEIK